VQRERESDAFERTNLLQAEVYPRRSIYRACSRKYECEDREVQRERESDAFERTNLRYFLLMKTITIRMEDMVDSIIFDLDGTLWDSTEEVAFSFNKVLKEKYPNVTDEVTASKLQSLFGKHLYEIAEKLFLSVPKEMSHQIIDDCCAYETVYLAENGAKLYDGLEEVLQELSKKYRLFIVSNCQEGYIQCFFKAYPHLEKYFIDYEYPGRSGKLKADNIRLVIERHHLQHPVYVGDTAGDADAAKEAGVPFIYARYGFGNVAEYDDVIDSLRELKSKLE